MKRLVLIRHATAVETGPQGSDYHRRLKKRGRREAAIMAGRLAPVVGTPDLLVSSPADRAVETARLFADRLGIPGREVALQERLYGGLLPDEFLRLVQALDDRHQCVLAFGHDPSFSEFAALMVPGFSEVIPKAGYVVIDLPRRRWSAVRAGEGQAFAFERPPAPDVQKRMETELNDRLAGSLRGAMFTALRAFGIDENPDVAKTVARVAARVARSVCPHAIAAAARRQTAGAVPRSKPRRPGRNETSVRKRRGKQS